MPPTLQGGLWGNQQCEGVRTKFVNHSSVNVCSRAKKKCVALRKAPDCCNGFSLGVLGGELTVGISEGLCHDWNEHCPNQRVVVGGRVG